MNAKKSNKSRSTNAGKKPARAMWVKLLLFLLCGELAALVSCIPPVGAPDPASSGLTISLHDNVSSRTLQPALDMIPASYVITGTGPGSATFTRTSYGESVTVDGLAFGSWTVVVQANNAASAIIGMGQATVNVNSGQSSTVSVTVTPLSGLGTLNLGLTWPAAQVQTPAIVSTLTPALGAAIPLDFTLSSGSASYSNTSLPNGYYTLVLKLQDTGIAVMGAVEIVRIVAGQETDGVYAFDNINQAGGSIQVNITPNMHEPLLVSIAGASATKAQSQNLNVSASVSNYGGNLTYVWYVNGDSVAAGDSWTMGTGYPAGYYRVDVTAFTNDGTRAGSATTQVQVLASGSVTAVQFVAGGASSFYLKPDGTLWGAGLNSYGQLGTGTATVISAPIQIMSDVRSVAPGVEFTLVIKNDGTLWGFGNNQYGQLGDGTTTSRFVPQQIMSGVRSASGGYMHSLAVKEDGTLWGFGNNQAAQFGDGTTTNHPTPVQMATNVVSASAGVYVSLFLKTDGTLWGCGYNNYGQLGDGTTTPRLLPFQMMTGVRSMSTSFGHTLVVKTDSSLWAFGNNTYGQLGDGTTAYKLTPVQVMTNVRSAAIGYGHSLVVKNDGTLWAFGYNLYGQLGIGSTSDNPVPSQVMSGIASVSAGYYHALVLKTDGTTWGFGWDQYGQLGDGAAANQLSPVQLTLWPTGL